MKTLGDAFKHTLKDVYYAEIALTKALPKVAKAVSAIEEHLAETKQQVKTLEKVFKSIGEKASGEKCDAIEGLIKETEGRRDFPEPSVADLERAGGQSHLRPKARHAHLSVAFATGPVPLYQAPAPIGQDDAAAPARR